MTSKNAFETTQDNPPTNIASQDHAQEGSVVGNLARGIFHGGVEDPYNGLTQFINHTAGSHLPEMHLVDANLADHTIAGKIGEGIGKVIDFTAVAAATGGIGSYLGMTSSALRMAATGAVYGGVFQPSNAESTNFYKDRAKTAFVDAATFATMAGAAGALNATGGFAVPAARSLSGSLLFGGIRGAAGGVVHAETTALTNGDKVPTASKLGSDLLTYTTFGALGDGIGYAANRMTLPEPVRIDAGRYSITMQNDQNGNLVSVDQIVPEGGFRTPKIDWKSVLMTDGQWKNSTEGINGSLRGPDATYTEPLELKGVQVGAGGAVTTVDQNGMHRTFTPGLDKDGFQSDLINAQRAQAAGFEGAQRTPDGWVFRDEQGKVTETFPLGSGYKRIFDEQSRLTQLNAQRWESDARSAAEPDKWSHSVALRYGEDGQMNEAAFEKGVFRMMYLNRSGADQWVMRDTSNDQSYTFDGNVRLLPPATPHGPERLEFTPKNGPVQTFSAAGADDSIYSYLTQQGKLQMRPGSSFISVDADGNTTLTAGSGNSYRAILNDTELKPGEVVKLEPKDSVVVKADVGDHFPSWEKMEYRLLRDKTAGFINLNGKPLKPGSIFELQTTNNPIKYGYIPAVR